MRDPHEPVIPGQHEPPPSGAGGESDPHEPVLPEGQQSPMAVSAPETEAPKLDEQLAETCVDQKAADEKQIAENEAQS